MGESKIEELIKDTIEYLSEWDSEEYFLFDKNLDIEVRRGVNEYYIDIEVYNNKTDMYERIGDFTFYGKDNLMTVWDDVKTAIIKAMSIILNNMYGGDEE